jgi:dATP pyrophosphohydrolase
MYEDIKELPFRIEAILYGKNSDGIVEYLLIKRTPKDGGYWQPITGTLDNGEKLHDCLFRELDEEVCVSRGEVKKLSPILYKFDWKNKRGETILEFVYAVEIDRKQKIKLNPTEHNDQRWCTYDLAAKTLYTDNNKKALQIIHDYLVSNA